MNAPALNDHLERTRAVTSTLVPLFGALANENRLLLLCQLRQGECSVGQLESTLAMRQPTLSQQLGVLRASGMVSTRRHGQRVFYSLDDARLIKLLGALEEIYCYNRICHA